MKDKNIEKLLKALDGQLPPNGLKETMLDRIIAMTGSDNELELTMFQRLFYESPLRAACIISAVLSGTLWAALGSNYATAITGIFGIG